jgi:AcrR family transcriptional regulator
VLDQRARNRAATERAILEAVHDLVTESHPAALSMPAVAERAGVGLRTLYRYFPSKEALLDAASLSMSTDAREAVGGTPTTETLGEYVRINWLGFVDQVAAIKAQHLTPAGRELRARRLPDSRRAVRRGLEERGVELPDTDQDRLVDLIVTITGSSTFLELVDRLGHDPEDAAALATWAVRALTDRARTDGGISP